MIELRCVEKFKRALIAKKKIMVVILVLVIVIGTVGAIVWQQFYKPEEAAAGLIRIIDDLGRNVR